MKLWVVLPAFETGAGLARLLASASTINGSAGADWLEGYARDDIIDGKEGDDVLGGGDGNDTLIGGPGNDTYYGGRGIDEAVLAGTLDDWTATTVGDILYLESLITGEVETIHDDVERVLFDDGGATKLVGTSYFFGVTLDSDTDGAKLIGTKGRDILTGNDADNILHGGISGDTLTGGAGDDIYTGSYIASFIELPDEGFDHINLTGSGGSVPLVYTVPGNIESIAPIVVKAMFDITGNSTDNVIFGAELDDTLSGAAGNDTLHGNNGNDLLSGEDGDDTAFGASGDDHLIGGNGADYLVGGSGADLLEGGAGDDILAGDDPGAEKAENVLPETIAPITGEANSGTNILFVSIDDLAPVFSVFPNALFEAYAPHLEAFFGASTVFTNAHATVPLCNASRAGILLGLSPEAGGVHTNDDPISHLTGEVQSLPKLLLDNGYYTAHRQDFSRQRRSGRSGRVERIRIGIPRIRLGSDILGRIIDKHHRYREPRNDR